MSTPANIYSHLIHQAAREAVDTIEHTLTRAEQKADRQARHRQLGSPRDHIQRLRDALDGLRSPAQAMVVATYNMVDAATSIEELTAAQDTARAAHDRFIDAAAAYVGLSRKRRNT